MRGFLFFLLTILMSGCALSVEPSAGRSDPPADTASPPVQSVQDESPTSPSLRSDIPTVVLNGAGG